MIFVNLTRAINRRCSVATELASATITESPDHPNGKLGGAAMSGTTRGEQPPIPRGRISRWRHRQRGEDADRLNSLIAQTNASPAQYVYLVDRWADRVLSMKERFHGNQNQYYALRLLSLIGAAVATVIVAHSAGGTLSTRLGWTAAILGVLTTTTTAALELFRPGERWRLYRHYAALVESEGWQLLDGPPELAPGYTGQAAIPDERWQRFHTSTESLLAQFEREYSRTAISLGAPPTPDRAGAGTADTTNQSSPAPNLPHRDPPRAT